MSALAKLLVLAGGAAAASVCSQLPYNLLLPLSGYAPAETFCSSKFPRPSCTSTVYSTSTYVSTTSTTTTVETDTITTTTATVPSTVETDYVTIDTTTNTDTSVDATSVIISTVLTTTTSINYNRQALKKRALKVTTTHKPTTTTEEPRLATLLSSLEVQAQSVISTLCSCIEADPICATTTILVNPSTTTTEVIPTTSSTTVNLIATTLVTYTSTVLTDTATTVLVETSTTSTTTSTSTSVIQLACPTAIHTSCDPCSYYSLCGQAWTGPPPAVVIPGSSIQDCANRAATLGFIYLQFDQDTNLCQIWANLAHPTGQRNAPYSLAIYLTGNYCSCPLDFTTT